MCAVATLGCARPLPAERPLASAVEPPAAPVASAPPPGHVELFFRGEQPFARRGDCPGPGCEEWALGDVSRGEMAFSPDGQRFAYVRQKGTQTPRSHIIVRNLAGDPINEFPAYRPGPLEELSWLDNRRLGYLAPDVPPAAGGVSSTAFVIHDADTGEILTARSGAEFIWGPRRRHLAFIAGSGQRQVLVVDGKTVWPRRGATRLHGAPVWSPDGHGLALVEDGAAGPRLVVMVEFPDPQGDLTWSIPRSALAPGLAVFWAGASKVVIGETALRPRFAADWQRLQ
jgi:hypothetical protein